MTLVNSKNNLALRGTVYTVLLFFVLCGFVGCGQSGPITSWTIPGETMGTTYNVKLITDDARHDNVAFYEVIEKSLDQVNDRMSTYQPDSELSLFNSSRETTPYTFSAMTMDVLDIALQVSEQSEGAFDITVGPLVNTYGFGPDGFDKVPTDEEREELLQRIGYKKLTLHKEKRALGKSQSDIYCDLSAVAKGYAVDLIVDSLKDMGVESAMVEVGGEVRTMGLNSTQQPWRIGIDRPTEGVRELQRAVPLKDKAMATSGDYRNFRIIDGKRISHTIDPRTGKPIDHALASVSVVHDACAWADAYATTLMVLGPEAGLAFAKEHKLAVLFLVHDGEDEFKEIMTPEFETLLGGE